MWGACPWFFIWSDAVYISPFAPYWIFSPLFTVWLLLRHLHFLLSSFVALLLCNHLLPPVLLWFSQSVYCQRTLLLRGLMAQDAVVEGICCHIPRNPGENASSLGICVGGYSHAAALCCLHNNLKTVTTI